MSGRRPNLLVIMTDQHDPQIAGFAGNGVIKTQALDALAARSVQFDSESALYDARWLPIQPGSSGGIIPQKFG